MRFLSLISRLFVASPSRKRERRSGDPPQAQPSATSDPEPPPVAPRPRAEGGATASAPPPAPVPAATFWTPPPPAPSPPATLSTPLAALAPAATFWTSPRPVSTFRMRYADRNGEITERVVTLGAVRGERDNESWIAFCHLRNAMRTFRPASALAFYDSDTGARIARKDIVAAPFSLFSDLALDAGAEEPADAPFRTIAQAKAYYETDLGARGWRLETRREPLADQLGLHRPKKRREGYMKYASIYLAFEPAFVDVSHEPRLMTPGRARDKPWRVGRPERSRCFARAVEAREAFEALAYDPEALSW